MKNFKTKQIFSKIFKKVNYLNIIFQVERKSLRIFQQISAFKRWN